MVVGAAVASIVVAAAIQPLIRSPQEVAADAAAPDLTVLTAKVERRALQATVPASGTLTHAGAFALSASAGAEGTRSIVTRRLVSPGSEVRAGGQLLEVSGRPVFYLRGDFPMYRDLMVGDRGTDVRQLQAALSNVGYAVFDPTGVFGASTRRAIADLYSDHGYALGTASAGGEAPQGNESVVVSASELVFGPLESGRVESVSVKVGQELIESFATLASTTPLLQLSLVPDQAEGVKPGTKVEVDGPHGIVDGRVTSVAAAKETDTGLVVAVTAELVADAGSGVVTARLVLDQSPADSLVVPVTAVFSDADGHRAVSKLVGNEQERVAVRTGVEGGGYVVVASLNGHLRAGDTVVVGTP